MTERSASRIIIICLTLVLGLFIFFSVSNFFAPASLQTTPNKAELNDKTIDLPNKISIIQSESKLISEKPSLLEKEQAQSSSIEPEEELSSEARLEKIINNHQNQAAENDLLRNEAKRLEQEIQQKIQSLEQSKAQ